MNENATFGGELRRARQASGLSLNELADRIHYSKGYLAKVETSIAPGNESLARLCDTELGTGGTLVALLPNGSTRRRAVRASAQPIAGLPALTAHFAGRDDDMNAVLQVLRDQPVDGQSICAIDGMAGVGKTALAVRCANRLEQSFADGCLFLDLRGHSADAAQVQPADALDRLLRLLGVPTKAIPGDVDDRALLYRDRLRGRSMLIVLDNAHSAGQVRPLLPGEPKCRVLITSRRRLVALDDARHVSLDVLPPAGAAELFRALAGIEKTDETDETVHSVVSRCGRLPLAIRIAAARLRSNPTGSVADLDRRLAEKSGRLAELDDGERSVAAIFRVSLEDLRVEQRAVFGALALHPGTDFDLHAAAALCGRTTRDVERVVERLREANLVEQRVPSRYRFNVLLREFAATTAEIELRPEQRADAIVRLLHLELVAVDAADRMLEPRRFRRPIAVEAPDGLAREFPDEDTALAWLRVEWPNLVALCAFAVENGYPGHGWQLAFSLRTYFFMAKLWDPWLQTRELALAAARATGDAWAEAVMLNNLGMTRIDSGELDLAADHPPVSISPWRHQT